MIDSDSVAYITSLAAQGKSIPEIAGTVGLEIGDVQTVLAGAARAYVEALAPGSSGGGGGGPGSPVVHRFVVQHDTAGIETGVPLAYVPAIGDLLLDVWIDVDEVTWNGTTPQADVAPVGFWDAFDAGLFGWFGGQPIDLTLGGQDIGGFWAQSADSNKPSVPLSSDNVHLGTPVTFTRLVPFRFTSTDPLLMVVSQDGTRTGGATGATAGEASVYLKVVTPIDPRMH